MDMNEVQLPENVVALHEMEGNGLDGRGHGSTQDLAGSEGMPDVITPYGAAVDSAILDEIVTAIRKYLYILEQDALFFLRKVLLTIPIDLVFFSNRLQ